MEIKKNDIFIADLKEANGSIQAGVRPVVILQNNVGNNNSTTTIIAPITSKLDKHKLPTHILLRNSCLKKESIILLEQIQTININQLHNKVGTITDINNILDINKALKISLNIL